MIAAHREKLSPAEAELLMLATEALPGLARMLIAAPTEREVLGPHDRRDIEYLGAVVQLALDEKLAALEDERAQSVKMSRTLLELLEAQRERYNGRAQAFIQSWGIGSRALVRVSKFSNLDTLGEIGAALGFCASICDAISNL